MNHQLTTAVIPVAGKGTRFLPVSKAVPKEMLPILDRPIIDYIVDEVVQSGIKRIIFITSSGKENLENYYDHHEGLEAFLHNRGKSAEVLLLKELARKIEIITVRQKEQLGLGHAILCAETVIQDDYFAVLLGDDLTSHEQRPVIGQLIDIHQKVQGPVIGVVTVPREETDKYGVIDAVPVEGLARTHRLKRMVEKPRPELAPSCLATPGRYILPREIFDIIKTTPRGAGNEFQLTDSIDLLAQKMPFFAYEFEGERYDTGNVLGHVEAIVRIGIKHPKYGDKIKEFLKSLDL